MAFGVVPERPKRTTDDDATTTTRKKYPASHATARVGPPVQQRVVGGGHGGTVVLVAPVVNHNFLRQAPSNFVLCDLHRHFRPFGSRKAAEATASFTLSRASFGSRCRRRGMVDRRAGGLARGKTHDHHAGRSEVRCGVRANSAIFKVRDFACFCGSKYAPSI